MTIPNLASFVLDRGALGSIAPMEYFSYLRAKGWIKVSDYKNKSVIWAKDDHDILLPFTSEVADFSTRMAELLKLLEKIEERSSSQIFYDLKHSTCDVIRVRVIHPNAEDGELPIEGNSNLQNGASELLIAAANSVEQKKAFYTRRFSSTTDFLKTTRIGQTERGSYIFKIICPIIPSPNNLPLLGADDNEDPFERKVTKTLVQALNSCKNASHKALVDGDYSAYQSGITDGLSANLLEAVAKIGEVFDKNNIEISVNWALNREIGSFDQPNKISISQDYIPLIKSAAKSFRETAVLDDYEVIGYVETLNRQTGSEEGDVSIVSNVEGRLRKVKMRLKDPYYTLAHTAHNPQEAKPVRCVGELRKEGKGFILDNPRSLSVINLDD